MKRSTVILRFSAMVIASLAILAAVCAFSLYRPLLKSADYKLVATIDSSPVEAQLFKAFPSGPYYIRLPAEPNWRYGWFGVAFARNSVFSPISTPATPFGLPYIHADQAHGVKLTDGKIEDTWTVSFTKGRVTFSSVSIRIELRQ